MSDIVRTLQQMIDTSLADVNTHIPGTIVSYDAARNRAVVRPDLPKRLASGDKLDAPNIVEVPIVWPASGGGKASFTLPVKPGDGVMLAFQQRSMEGWLSGDKSMPDDPRQHDLSDCVALAGCAPGGIAAHPDDVLLKSDKSQLRITPDNTVTLGNDNGYIHIDGDGDITIYGKSVNIINAGITIDGAGNVTIHGNSITVNAGGKHFNLEHHHHSGVVPGGGQSNEPVDT